MPATSSSYSSPLIHAPLIRGAHGSAGRTSWTAKAERADYMSVVGFVSHYVHFLDPFAENAQGKVGSMVRNDPGSDGDGEVTSPIHIRPPTPTPPQPLSRPTEPIMLLGGYSYGSMITSQLPSLETILGLFNAPECGSSAAEIRLRAQHLAEMQNTVLASAREAAADHLRPRSPRKHVGLRVGGDEDSRRSHESRRSRSTEFEETIRHGVAELMARTRKGHRRSHSGRSHTPRDSDEPSERVAAPDHLLPLAGRTTFLPAYLLVSPLQGIISSLATMSLPPLLSVSGAWARFSTRGNSGTVHSDALESGVHDGITPAEAEDKLVQNATLAVYGDRDGFVPVRKLRAWASRLEGIPDSKFRAHEVSSATHFWAQGNVASTLRDAVGTFGGSLLDGKLG
jgi:alpha/beta superfamily hydrolase